MINKINTFRIFVGAVIMGIMGYVTEPTFHPLGALLIGYLVGVIQWFPIHPQTRIGR
jgi:hypothetical protein